MYRSIILVLLFSISAVKASVQKEDSFYNKHYLSSFLGQVYGEKVSAIIQEKIIKRGDVFAGACDPYSLIKKGTILYRKNYGCFRGFHEMNKSPVGKSSSVRSLLMNEICSEIVKVEGAVKYSLRGLSKEFNFENFSRYSEIFRLTVDKNIFNQIRNKKSPWVITSKIFCRSEKWQKP